MAVLFLRYASLKSRRILLRRDASFTEREGMENPILL
jgi:hypothetical protein